MLLPHVHDLKFYQLKPEFFQVKLLLESLVEKCELDAIMAVMPQEHMELLAEVC